MTATVQPFITTFAGSLDAKGRVSFDVPAYGYLWLRVRRPGDGRVG